MSSITFSRNGVRYSAEFDVVPSGGDGHGSVCYRTPIGLTGDDGSKRDLVLAVTQAIAQEMGPERLDATQVERLYLAKIPGLFDRSGIPGREFASSLNDAGPGRPFRYHFASDEVRAFVHELLRLAQIELRNFRCFEHLKMTLDPELTLIVAGNAGGKTALLAGIAAGLGVLVGGSGGSFRQSDVRSFLRADRTTLDLNYPCEVATEGIVQGQSHRWRAEIQQGKQRPTLAGSTEARRILRNLLAHGGVWPLVAFYSTHRATRGQGVNQDKRPQTAVRLDAFRGALTGAANVDQMLTWLWRAQVGMTQGKRLPAFEAVRAAILTACRYPLGSGQVLTPKDLHIDPQSGLPVLTFSDGQQTPWDRLSDGFHTHLALVADLAWRAAILNEHLGTEAVRETRGVVLVDEIDLHLHPRWQREVIESLRQAFPHLQFIMTTHSAQVMASVRNDQIRVLDQGLLVADEAPVEGRDSNSILAHVMGDRSMPAESAAQLAELYHHLDAGDLARARAILDRFRQHWGTDDATVTEAAAQLAWAEAG